MLQGFLWDNADKLEQLPGATICGSYIDFDRLEHADVIKVIRTFGGKWKKSLNGTERVDYERKLDCGITLRCWNGKPPPSCRVVEIEEEVPEQVIPAKPAEPERIIPAHKRKVRKMICTDHPEPVAVAIAQAQ